MAAVTDVEWAVGGGCRSAMKSLPAAAAVRGGGKQVSHQAEGGPVARLGIRRLMR